ncbi:hypothetical protein CBL_20297, partial [Carabus blaptoides fortunei]
MDIRSFFKKRKTEDTIDAEPHKKENKTTETNAGTSSTIPSVVPQSTLINEFDIGLYVNSQKAMTFEINNEILSKCWTPSETYDFKKDSITEKRAFRLLGYL